MILIVVKYRTKPEYTEQWPEIVREFTEATRAEPGNIFFEWSRSVEVDDEWVLVEAFQDDAGEAHVTSDHFAKGLEAIGEPAAYSYWDFGTDLAMICGRHGVAAIGYSPMQEYYCHRPVDMCRIDFMERALVGNIAIFNELTQLEGAAFKL